MMFGLYLGLYCLIALVLWPVFSLLLYRETEEQSAYKRTAHNCTCDGSIHAILWPFTLAFECVVKFVEWAGGNDE